MPRDQFSFPYYVEILLEDGTHRAQLTAAIATWQHKIDTSGIWAIVNFEEWDAAIAAGDNIDAYLDNLGIPHNIILNSRLRDFRRWI